MISAGTPDIVDTESKVVAERVLIVEDDGSARVGLEQLVRSWGFIAESACDGEEALEKVTSFRPAIVITDMVMPKVGGRELAAQIAELRPEMKVIYMTGYAERLAASNGDSQKAVMLTKPFTRLALARTVSKVLKS